MTIFPVILSGGSGTRLWPLSREKYPKQFIRNLCPIPDDNGKSLLGDTLTRLHGEPGYQPPTLLCNNDHRFLVTDELARAGIEARAILLEPVARNTAPAITLAALSAVQSDPDAVLVVMPCDHVIADKKGFRDGVRKASAIAAQNKLVLFGIKPQSPHTGYGYIRRGDALTATQQPAYRVDGFFEKPDAEVAATYLADGRYFWNSGIFVLHGQTFLEEVKRLRPEIYDACQPALMNGAEDLDFLRVDAESFARNPAISVDYAIMEKTDRAAMVPLDVGWNDVGSWPALRQLGSPDADGNVTNGEESGSALMVDSRNTYVHTDGTLVATLGVEDLVIVNTDDALLVAASDRAQDVGKLAQQIKESGRLEYSDHKRHHRPWGTFDILNQGPGFKVKRISVNPGSRLSLQMHRRRSEHWVVVSGTAKVSRGDVTELIEENQSTYISVREWHRLENPGDEVLEIIEVQIGAYLEEDDIERAGDDYNRSTGDG